MSHQRAEKSANNLRVHMWHYPMYAGKPEQAFNNGPLTIYHTQGMGDCTIQLTNIEEIRDLHYMLGAMLNRLEGKS